MNITEQCLAIRGHQLGVLSANQTLPGAPVVFLHGALTSMHFWPSLLPQVVREHHPWFSLSLPAHFPSRLPPGKQRRKLTPRRFAHLLNQALCRLVGNRAVVLVGWSTGAFAALNLAARKPYRVAAVCSIAGFADGRWSKLFGLLQWLAVGGNKTGRVCEAILSLVRQHPALYRVMLSLNAEGRLALPPEPVIDRLIPRLYADFCRHDPANITLFFKWIAGCNITPVLPYIKAPTLLVSGDRDPIVPRRHSRKLAQRIPGAEWIELANTSHLFFARRLPQVQQAMDQWLATRLDSVVRTAA